MSDVLDEALRAVRENVDGEHAGAATTRMRILERARRARRSRQRIVLVVMPLAAAFAASLAWAAVTGRLSHWLSASGAPYGPSADAQPATDTDSPEASTPLALVDAGAASETMPAPSGDVQLAPSASSASLAPRSPPTVASASSAEQSLYAAAHRAHFESHDSGGALNGWNAYLAAYPNGHFALEARYNRAICLVRLGRRGEARQALAPFARGDFGGYRQHEAAGLLDALTSSDGG